jgi:5-methylcytosine-specific restriction endonuclease McrA
MGRPRIGFEPSEKNKKENARIRSARYYAAHPERAQGSSKRWRDKDRQHVNAVSIAYAKEHREKYRVHCTVRRTRKTAAGGAYTSEQWIALCDKYHHKCLCCNESKPLTADHVIPVSKGGTSWIENIQPLCLSCNCRKGEKTTDYRRTQ